MHSVNNPKPPSLNVILQENKLCLNIGCGESYLDGFINIDCVEGGQVKVDLLLDITTQPLPYKDNSVDEIWMIHSLEHIEIRKWDFILGEFHRVLKVNGILCLSYPEFRECAKRFLADTNKQRNFWRATLYGRQLYKSDYHVCPMDSNEIKEILETIGFYRVKFTPESNNEPYNTIMVGYKDPEQITREAILTKELGLTKEIKLELGEALKLGDSI